MIVGLSLDLSQGATPPIKAAAVGFSVEKEAFQTTAKKPRPEPAEVLHLCKTQVAELELWLHQANVAFEPETLNAAMQQVVEQQLAGCQVRPMGQSSGLRLFTSHLISLLISLKATVCFFLLLRPLHGSWPLASTFWSQGNYLK